MRFQKILIAPDKFKGTLTAVEAARAIERGLRVGLGARITARLLPIADGGEGTTDAICAVLPHARMIAISSTGPRGEPCECAAVLAGDDAFFEMSATAGLKLVPQAERDPWRLTTRGVGFMMKALAERGAKNIHAGLGGSATNDAGLGAGEALGFRFLDEHGRAIAALPENCARIAAIVPPVENPLRGAQIIALCDVANPLLGPEGASHVYGPQKGLRDPERMDAALARIADIVARDLGVDYRNLPGAGAAGGLGYGLMTFCGAKLKPGFETIAAFAGIEAAVRECDLVITGEGRLDSQTLFGKGPAELARLARREGKPAIAFGGCIEVGAEKPLRELFADIRALEGPDAAGAGAAAALEATVARFFEKKQ